MNKNVKQINTKKSHPTENAIIDTKNDFIAWIKTHKKQLILASIGITTIIGTILVFKNNDILEISDSLNKKLINVPDEPQLTSLSIPDKSLSPNPTIHIKICPSPTMPINIRRHIRTLPVGYCHSPEKKIEIANLGIKLPLNQTTENPYTKCVA